MTSEVQFHSNLQIWSRFQPKEATLLPYIDCSEYQFCTTKEGERNLRYENFYLHDQNNALEEAKEWFSSLVLGDTKILYLYGIGLGYYYLVAKEWLSEDENRMVIFLDDNQAIIHRFFETDLAAEFLQNPQAQLYYFRDLDAAAETFREIYWQTIQEPYIVSGLNAYRKYRSDQYIELKHQISHDIELKNKLVDEYLHHGVAFYRNFYSNLPLLSESTLVTSLFNRFQGVPAIICGAGPSLEKNVGLLQSLADKAVIFAGGSALNVVEHHGVTPHFGAGIDPNVHQEKRIKKLQEPNLPFLYRARMYHPALALIQGPKVYVQGAVGYDTAEWIEKQLGIPQIDLEEGHNVVTFCLEIARRMGCHPIIFLGMDLALTGEKVYGSGVEGEYSFEEAKLLPDAIIKKDIEGNDVYTFWKYVIESLYISDYQKEHPELTLINATEGGLGFSDIPNRTLKEVIDEYLEKSYPIQNEISKTLESKIQSVDAEKIKDILQELHESLSRCISHLNVLLQEAQSYLEKVKTDPNLPYSQSGKAALAETELAEEEAFHAVLAMFNNVYTRVLHRKMRKLQILEGQERVVHLLQINVEKFRFLKEVAESNREILRMTLGL